MAIDTRLISLEFNINIEGKKCYRVGMNKTTANTKINIQY